MVCGDDFVFFCGDFLYKSLIDVSSVVCNKLNLGGYVDGDQGKIVQFFFICV